MLSVNRHVILLVSAAALTGLAVVLDRPGKTPVRVSTLRNPSAAANNPLDRLAWKVPNSAAANLADAGLYGGPTLPLLLAFHPRARPHYPAILLAWLENTWLTFALTSVIKNIANRPRPYVLHPSFDEERQLLRNDRAAFLSGHAAMAAAGSGLFAQLAEKIAPNAATEAWLIAGGYTGFTAYLRVRAAKHWPTDAIAGIILGLSVATAVFALNEEYIGDDSRQQKQYWAQPQVQWMIEKR